MNDESRELLDHIRNVANTSTMLYEAIDPKTLRFLVAQIDKLEAQLSVNAIVVSPRSWNEMVGVSETAITMLWKKGRELEAQLAAATAERDQLRAQLDAVNQRIAAANMVASNMKAEWDAMREERDNLQALVKELENPDFVKTITPLRELFAEYFDSVASLTYISSGKLEGKIKGDDL